MNDEEKTKRQLIDELKELRKLGKIMEHSNELYYVHDTNHLLSYASPQSLQILGYTPDEMMIQWTNLATENPINKLGVKITAKALKTGEKQKPYLLELYKKDRSTVLLEIDESPMKDDLGNVVGIIGAARDITQRKQAEEEKDRILNLSHDLICIMGTDGYFKYANPAWERTLGYSQEELISKSVFDIVHQDERQKNYDDFVAFVASNKQELDYENHLIHKDGSIRIVSWTSTLLLRKGLIYCIGHDITERNKAEQALQQREKDLAIQAENLQEVNTALKVLLKKREEDKIELEEKVLLNIKELVLPYFDKIKKGGLDKSQSAYADILESHLNEIVSSFSYRLSSAHLNLTPTEINVANLVKQGKTNKEIAELLNVSTRTAAFHREHIRQKLGIKNKKTNLKSYLSSID